MCGYPWVRDRQALLHPDGKSVTYLSRSLEQLLPFESQGLRPSQTSRIGESPALTIPLAKNLSRKGR
jgi:hypothetical protein